MRQEEPRVIIITARTGGLSSLPRDITTAGELKVERDPTSAFCTLAAAGM